MTRKLVVAGAAALVVAACSGRAAPAGPGPIDPVGFYDFTAMLGGDQRAGTLEIERTPAGLDAEAWVDGESQPALADSVVVDGRRVRIYALVGGGDAVDFDLQFDGPSFTGYILVALDSIQVSGTRRAR